MRRGIALLVLAALSGCYSFSSFGRARILDPGRTELWVAPEALLVAGSSGLSIRPVGDLGARYGLTSRVELDARLSTLGLTLGPRLQLWRSPSDSEGVDVALAPAVAYTYADKLALELPVLVGINLPGGNQIVLGARAAYLARLDVPGYSRPVSFVLVGGSVGFAWRVSERFTLLPEVALLGQVFAEPGFNSNVGGGLGIQAGIGVLFDP